MPNQDQRKHKTWSVEEDQYLITLKEERRVGKWVRIASQINAQFHGKDKTGPSCRERYINYLKQPEINNKWSEADENLLLQKYMEFGSSWNYLADYFKDKSQNGIKNKFNCSIRKISISINKSAKKKVTVNSLLKLLHIFHNKQNKTEKFQQIQEQYQELRQWVLKTALLSSGKMETFKATQISQRLIEFNRLSRFMNSTKRTKVNRVKQEATETDKSQVKDHQIQLIAGEYNKNEQLQELSHEIKNYIQPNIDYQIELEEFSEVFQVQSKSIMSEN